MPQGQLDQLPDLRQLALAAPDVVVADLVQALIVITLSYHITEPSRKHRGNIASYHITSYTGIAQDDGVPIIADTYTSVVIARRGRMGGKQKDTWYVQRGTPSARRGTGIRSDSQTFESPLARSSSRHQHHANHFTSSREACRQQNRVDYCNRTRTARITTACSKGIGHATTATTTPTTNHRKTCQTIP